MLSHSPRLPCQFLVRLLHEIVHPVGDVYLSCYGTSSLAYCIVHCLEKENDGFQRVRSSYIVHAEYNKLHNAKKADVDPELHSAADSRNNNVPCVVRTMHRLRLDEKLKSKAVSEWPLQNT